ncbi:hypothetical protein [Streptomyces sp. NPDC059015]|uniref:hypothetical protein n=1 Tax=unclassified Streptomyces TaxID=2593676 RepID=UPI0036BDAF17
MADDQDKTMRYFSHRLSMVYTALVNCCAHLPIPISLPTKAVDNLSAVPAVRRITEIAEEQPMPEEQHAALYTGSLMWLVAMDVFSILVVNEYDEIRAHGGIAATHVAEDALMELAQWLQAQQD